MIPISTSISRALRDGDGLAAAVFALSTGRSRPSAASRAMLLPRFVFAHRASIRTVRGRGQTFGVGGSGRVRGTLATRQARVHGRLATKSLRGLVRDLREPDRRQPRAAVSPTV